MGNQLLQKINRGFKTACNYLVSRGAAFYLLLPVVLMSVVTACVYKSGFEETVFYSVAVFVLPFAALIAFGLVFYKPTSRYASVVMFVLALVTLAVFLKTSYMYLSTPFYNGIDPNSNVFKQAGFYYSFCALTMVINIVLCAVAAFFKPYREKEPNRNSKLTEVAE